MVTIFYNVNCNLNDMFSQCESKTAITTSIPSKQNTVISQFTVSKNGIYVFMPQFRTSFSDDGILTVGVFSNADLQYPVSSYAGSETLYVPKNTTACMNGINFKELTAGVTYYIVAYQTNPTPISVSNDSWYSIMLMKKM